MGAALALLEGLLESVLMLLLMVVCRHVEGWRGNAHRDAFGALKETSNKKSIITEWDGETTTDTNAYDSESIIMSSSIEPSVVVAFLTNNPRFG